MRDGRRHLSLAWLLGLSFGGLSAIAIATVFFLGWDGLRNSTRELISIRSQAILDGVTGAIDDLLQPVESQARALAQQVSAGRLDPDDVRGWRDTLSGAASSLPQVFSVLRVSPDHRAYIFNPAGGKIEVFDWSTVEDIRNLVETYEELAAGEIRWGEPILTTALDPPQPLLVLRTPLHRNGAYEGVLLLAVTLSDLSRHLWENTLQGPHVPYVLYGEAQVLAHPRLIRGDAVQIRGSARAGISIIQGSQALTSIDDLGDAFLDALPRARPVTERIVRPIPDTFVLLANTGATQTVYVQRQITGFGVNPWTVGTYFDAGVAQVELARLRNLAIAGGVVLVLSIVLALLIGQRAAKPMRRLAEAARSIREGDLDDVPRMPGTRILELDEAGRAFNTMVEGLQERELIRKQFGRYVPEAVASAILAEDGRLEPRTTEATILFIDLEGFTAMSEEMRPEEIVQVLNEYFSAVVTILESRNGVATQFQGDAILATFNVPVADAGHARNAVECAIELLHMTATQTFAHRRLGCRIGINTGMVLAGAVGAAGRLNYTVHGDAVNLAARLEVMNRELGTRVLVAAETARRAPEFPYAEMGSLAVRGKEHPAAIYTIEAHAWGG